MTGGYKGMLRDRVPQTIDFALKWCKAKERWIEHVYETQIKIASDNNTRKELTKAVLGLKDGKPKHFDFHKSIEWDQFDMTEDEAQYWCWVESWVNWFQKTYIYIESKCKSMIDKEYSDDFIKKSISNSFLQNYVGDDKDKLSEYLLSCVKKL